MDASWRFLLSPASHPDRKKIGERSGRIAKLTAEFLFIP
jgi:hypothetical protein